MSFDHSTVRTALHDVFQAAARDGLVGDFRARNDDVMLCGGCGAELVPVTVGFPKVTVRHFCRTEGCKGGRPRPKPAPGCFYCDRTDPPDGHGQCIGCGAPR